MADTNISDISKMKVIDLRKDLKSRGLPSTGDKAELIARLQAALSPDVKDDHSDEQVAWDEIDSDGVLEEDEKNHHDLLDDSAVESINEELALSEQPPLSKISSSSEQPSPADSKPVSDGKHKRTIKRKITMSESGKDKESGDKATQNKETVAKKIVLNRSTSINSAVPAPNDSLSEKTEETLASESVKTEDASTNNSKIKISADLDAKTRLELRAKRFGLPVKMSDTERKEARKQRFSQNAAKNTISYGNLDTNLDKLKKRAERFGQSVSKFMTEVENKNKLERRKAKFGTVK